MSKLLTGSIDLSKINESKIVEKNGHRYLNIAVWVNDTNIAVWVNDTPDQFGNDAGIQQHVAKEP
jgi:hypothetical protein